MDKAAAVEELRRRVEDIAPLAAEPNFFQADDTLVRFLKAREWDLKEAERLLKATIEWRRVTKPLQVDCTWCHDRPGFHSLRQVGFDEMGRPVIYSSFAQASIRRTSVEDSVAHMTYLIENAKLTMRPGVHTWVFIIDCKGMTIPSCNPKLGYGVTQVMSNHYPERLGMVVCLNHSPVFQGVWKAIRVFLHPNTVAKMQLVRSKRKITELFQKFFSEELTKWLLDEIKLNKSDPLSKSQKEFWKAPEDKEAHDPRGCPSYVREYIDGFQFDSNCHKPHPNIVDTKKGIVKPVIPATPEPLRPTDGAMGGSAEDLSDFEDLSASVEDLNIGEEFQIPKDAKVLEAST